MEWLKKEFAAIRARRKDEDILRKMNGKPGYTELVINAIVAAVFLALAGLVARWAFNQLAPLWHGPLLSYGQAGAAWLFILSIRRLFTK